MTAVMEPPLPEEPEEEGSQPPTAPRPCGNILNKEKKAKKKPCGTMMVQVGSFFVCPRCDQLSGQDNFSGSAQR